jgi:arylsulfatase A-like enzyme
VTREAAKAANISGNDAVHSATIRGNLPDIILFTIDTLSAGHLHTYGYERPTSPNLDTFSADAIVFDNFYANANWTRPGVASILNGVRPWTHEGDVDIPSHELTGQQNLIKILAAAGYDVDIVQSNDFADFNAQGIERPTQVHEIFLDSCYRFFRWIPIDRLPSATIAANSFGLFRRIELVENNFFLRPEGKSLPYLSASEALLRNASSQRPLFFWIHVLIPHDPYASSAPFLGFFDSSPGARSVLTSEAYENFANHIDQKRQNLLRARYDEAILMTDDLFGRFIQILKQQERFDHSLIVVTADHGESFLPIYGLHGGPLLTEELIRVPCLIKPPASFTQKHESLLMEQADLVPTILSYAGLPVPAGSEGHSYPGKPDNLPIYSMNRDFKTDEKTLNVAMREGDWKYVVHLGHWKHPWPRRELYNLGSDPKEQVSLVSSQPERAASMQQRVLAAISQHGISLSGY